MIEPAPLPGPWLRTRSPSERQSPWLILGLLVVLLWRASPAIAAPENLYVDVELGGGEALSLAYFPGTDDAALLWLSPEYELGVPASVVAERLGAGTNEVWFADLVDALFLPPLPGSLTAVRNEDVATVIDTVHAASGKPVYLIAVDHAAGLALGGAAEWRRQHPGGTALGGAILLHPYLYAASPEPGAEAEFLRALQPPAVPVFILQPKLSPGRWRLAEAELIIETGGGRVHSILLPAVRDRFLFRADATPEEDAVARLVPELLRVAVAALKNPTSNRH